MPQLETASIDFLLREPRWHEPRSFCGYELAFNLHISRPDCLETTRHKILSGVASKEPGLGRIYAIGRREALEASRKADVSMAAYTT